LIKNKYNYYSKESKKSKGFSQTFNEDEKICKQTHYLKEGDL